jgi:hypothetical protein
MVFTTQATTRQIAPEEVPAVKKRITEVKIRTMVTLFLTFAVKGLASFADCLCECYHSV